MYLKPRTKLRLHFNHTLNDYDDIDDVYFPNEGHRIKRAPMRRRYNKEGQNPWTEYHSDLGHGCVDLHTADTMIEGFIHKNIGNKFDDVFHEFVTKAKFHRSLHCYGHHTPHSMFLDYFEKEKHHRGQGDYYVDDNGLICQVPWEPRRSKDITIYRKLKWWHDKYIYTLREDALRSVSAQFISLFGENLYEEILHKRVYKELEYRELCRRLTKHHNSNAIEEAFNQVRRFRDSRSYWCERTKWEGFLFSSKYNNIERVIRYGTKEYFKYLKEQKHAEAMALREKRHPDRSSYDSTLKTQKLRRNARKREEAFERMLKDLFKEEV